jgi:hypothetical protein
MPVNRPAYLAENARLAPIDVDEEHRSKVVKVGTDDGPTL